MTHEYLPALKQIIRSLKDFDFLREDYPVRLIALKCAGEYLRSYPEPEFLELLLSIQDRRNSEKKTIQYGAYIAILRAVGQDWSSIPKFEDINLDTGLERDSSLVYKARQMLKKQCAEKGIMRSLRELYKEASGTKFDDEKTLSDEEIDYVAQQLENPTSDMDLWLAANILVDTEAVKYKSLMEKYLCCPEHPSVSLIILEGFCNWGYAKDYLDLLKQFMQGVDWDKDGMLLVTASDWLEDFIKDELNTSPHSEKSKELIKFLLDLYQNGKNDSIRKTAFSTLSGSTKINEYELNNPKSAYHIDKLRDHFDLN